MDVATLLVKIFIVESNYDFEVSKYLDAGIFFCIDDVLLPFQKAIDCVNRKLGDDTYLMRFQGKLQKIWLNHY